MIRLPLAVPCLVSQRWAERCRCSPNVCLERFIYVALTLRATSPRSSAAGSGLSRAPRWDVSDVAGEQARAPQRGRGLSHWACSKGAGIGGEGGKRTAEKCRLAHPRCSPPTGGMAGFEQVTVSRAAGQPQLVISRLCGPRHPAEASEGVCFASSAPPLRSLTRSAPVCRSFSWPHARECRSIQTHAQHHSKRTDAVRRELTLLASHPRASRKSPRSH